METFPNPESFKSLIDESLDKAYEDIAAKEGLDPAEVYKEKGKCEKVSEILAKELNLRGMEAVVHQYKGWDIKDHDFVLVEFNSEKWVIDPAWQQFLPETDSSKPRALICPLVELESCIAENGIPENWRHIWKI